MNRFLKYLLFFAASLLVACANVVSPSGGPKDIEPPVLLNATPENLSTTFSSPSITLSFDEFVVLKDFSQQFISSPPLKTPDAKAKGKTITLTFKDTLLENSTYTLSFGNSIVDLHEGNVFEDFHYVFATGNELDAHYIHGHVCDAFTMEAVKKASILLYEGSNADSLPYNQKPLYTTRTDENGVFNIRNIQNRCYHVVAIKDDNSNLKYDKLSESIGFSSECVWPKLAATTNDSIVEDSNAIETHSQDELKLFLFKEKQAQTVENQKLSENGSLTIKFKNRVEKAEKKRFQFLEPTIAENEFFARWNAEQTQVDLWFKHTDAKQIKLGIEDDEFFDTLVVINDKAIPESCQPLKLSLKTTGKQNFFDSIKLTFGQPITNVNGDILLFSESDTLVLQAKFTNKSFTEIILEANLLQETSYGIFIKDSVFTSFYGCCNDSTMLTISTNHIDQFASLELNITAVSEPLLIQMMDGSQKVVEERSITADEVLKFPYLKPDSYSFRAIVDNNQNKRWDSGNYLEGIQPEKIVFFGKKITCEAGWDYSENWVIEN